MRVVNERSDIFSTKAALVAIPVRPSQIVELEKSKGRRQKRLSRSILIRFNEASNGMVAAQIRRARYKGATGKSLIINVAIGDGPIEIVLLYGVDEKPRSHYHRIQWNRRFGSAIADVCKRSKVDGVAISADLLDVKNSDAMQALLEGVHLSNYAFEQYKGKGEGEKRESLHRITDIAIHSTKALPLRVAENAGLTSEATCFARDLVNVPPCDCTPSYLVQQSRVLAKKGKVAIEVFDRKALLKLGAGSLLSVAKGSDEPPYLIKMVYKPRKRTGRVVSLVGKGVTFDSGGLSLKTASGMETMKCDMAGAAAVMAVMKVIDRLAPTVEVRAYVPTTENMVNGRATRPGDVVTAMTGKTIEILNTDAEGRLILADAIALAERDGCDTIIDLATLTGACVVALGPDYAGLFCDNEKLTSQLMSAADRAGERLWRMPLAEEYEDWMKSSVADLKNISGRQWGGAITGALFLKEFVGKPAWAHLDIAGPAFAEGDAGFVKKGGVGFGVRTLLSFLKAI